MSERDLLPGEEWANFKSAEGKDNYAMAELTRFTVDSYNVGSSTFIENFDTYYEHHGEDLAFRSIMNFIRVKESLAKQVENNANYQKYIANK